MAVTGGIKDNIVEAEDKAFFLAEYVLVAYKEAIAMRYDIKEMPDEPYDLLVKIGQQRGALKAGGRVDLTRISSLFLNEFRTGVVGRITLETPAMMHAELKEVALLLTAKAAKDESRKSQYKRKR